VGDDGVERREDPVTGGFFTKAEFIGYYGNDAIWSASSKASTAGQ